MHRMQPSPADARVHIDAAALITEEDTGDELDWKTDSANGDTGDESVLGMDSVYGDSGIETDSVPPVFESSDDLDQETSSSADHGIGVSISRKTSRTKKATGAWHRVQVSSLPSLQNRVQQSQHRSPRSRYIAYG